MLPLIAAAVLSPVAYAFPADKPAQYDVQVVFDGFIPIMGGQTGTVAVGLGITAQAAGKDSAGNPQAVTELDALKLTFNGAEFPLTLESAKKYFPRTTISVTPQGKVLKTDAPNVAMPVRLPGLDVKRIPDITFVPVEFPVDGVEAGKEWTYKKPFGDSDVTYDIKATSVTPDKVEMDIKMSQSYDNLEDAAKNIPTDPKDAVSKVHTDVTGIGHAVFDRTVGLIKSAKIDADAVSKVTAIADSSVTERDLKTHLTINLTSGGTVQNAGGNDRLAQIKAQAAFYWEMAKIKAQPMIAGVRKAVELQIAALEAWLAKG